MTSYVVGDIQGCYSALLRLLEQANFQPDTDQLWCAGDLVNRGGESAQLLEYLYAIRSSVQIVLGNHDLYLLALMAGNSKKPATPDLTEVVQHRQAAEWFQWLRQQPLAYYDQARNTMLSHAGVPHIWTVQQTLSYANEVQGVLAGTEGEDFLQQIYGNSPDLWHASLAGTERLRCIVNYLTRMRFITSDGHLDLQLTGGIDCATQTHKPWFSYPRPEQESKQGQDSTTRFIFGHWAALQGNTGSIETMPLLATDTGCIWNGVLSLFNLDDPNDTYSTAQI